MLSRQDLFSKVESHLLQQDRKARDEKGHCVYRGSDAMGPTKCAAGCLIEDKDYLPMMEGSSCGQTLLVLKDGEKLNPADMRLKMQAVQTALIAGGVNSDDLELVACLQTVHDSWSVSEWRRKLRDVASQFGLVSVA